MSDLTITDRRGEALRAFIKEWKACLRSPEIPSLYLTRLSTVIQNTQLAFFHTFAQ
jgi:hypothetical protein